MADISNIPKKINELIENKAYGRFSPEIYWNYKGSDANGKTFKRVLKAVALLGGDTPACTTMDDFIDLYEEEQTDGLRFVQYDKDLEVKFYENLETETKEIDVDNLKEYTDKIAKLESELAEKTAELTKKEDEIKAVAEDNSKLVSYKEEIEKKEKELVVAEFISKNKEKITPATEKFYRAILARDEMGVKEYSVKEGDVDVEVKLDTYSLLQGILDNTPKFVETDEISKKSEEKKEYTKEEIADGTELDDKVKAYMSEHKNLTYKEALLIVSSDEN